MSRLQFITIKDSDKIKVVRYHLIYRHIQPIGWIEHEKDDWNSWYFYSDEGVLLDVADMQAIIAKIDEL